jgi:hypothetical protein
VTNFGEGDPAMLAEAFQIKSTLWSSPALSDRGRVLGKIQLSAQNGKLRAQGRSRSGLQAQRDLHSTFVNRLICETSSTVKNADSGGGGLGGGRGVLWERGEDQAQ